MTETNDFRELAAAARLLSRALPEATPPPDLKLKVLAAVERAVELTPDESSVSAVPVRRRWPRPALATGIGALAAAAAILLLALPLGEPAGELELRTTLTSPSGAVAAVEVRMTGIGRAIQLRTDELPILPRGDYYELWFVGPRDTPAAPNRISAGTFHPDEDGRSDVMFTAAVDPALYPVLSVTAEPGDGDPHPNGPEVLRSQR